MELIKETVIRAGQARAYQDSVYEYTIETTKGTADEAWELCQSIKKANNRKDGTKHDGACGFPFGLDSFGSIRPLNQEGTSWRYCVTYPYCD